MTERGAGALEIGPSLGRVGPGEGDIIGPVDMTGFPSGN